MMEKQKKKKKKIDFKYNPKDFFLDRDDYSMWSEDKEESFDKEEWFHKKESEDLPSMPPLVGDEGEVKLEPEETIDEIVRIHHQKITGKGLKILTPNKLFSRFPILLAQIKAGNYSCELKNEIRQIQYLLYQHNKITKKICNKIIKSL